MTRLGESIRTARNAQNMSAKALAKRTGVTEKFIIEVESGSRIINEETAKRILGALGSREEMINAFSEPEGQKSGPVKKTPAPKEKEQVSELWQNALGGILRKVPVMDMAQNIKGYISMATEDGKLLGYPPDKVSYFIAPDNAMQGFRIRKDDRVLVVPAHEPIDGAVMLIEYGGERMLVKSARSGERFTLMRYEHTLETLRSEGRDVKVLGRAVRAEFDL
jgi:transcriptional regulator with XRE-family HTH domain